jgi:hypothetical protein
MAYIEDPLAQLRKDLNDLSLVQINPDVAVDLRLESENYGWAFTKKESEWEKIRKLDANDIERAHDQLSEMMILDASSYTKPKIKKKM